MQRTMSRRVGLAGVVVAGFVLAMSGSLTAQDFDLEIRVDKERYEPGEAVACTVGIATRAPGVQGWSYGVAHDASLLTLSAVTFDGTDAQGVFMGGFNQTRLIEEGGANIGFIQAVVLTFGGDAQIPTDQAFFSLALASYTAGACPGGATEDVPAAIEFSEELAVPGSPPVEINVTVSGVSAPFNTITTSAVLACQGDVEPPAGLTIAFNDDNNDLVADASSTLDVNVLLSSGGGATDAQGWSYGVALDPAAITATAGAPGADAAALNGGNGPDFVSYDLADMSADGSAMGVTVGVVISTAAPATEVLSIGDGETKHIDTITVRSTAVLAADSTTQLSFNGTMGDFEGRDPIEIIVVVGGQDVTPDSTSTKTINLMAGAPPDTPLFIRADANNDARVDIADGIWIIGMLFYGTEMTACTPAADANDDNSVDMSDAIYMFQYQLQPGATPGNLFPAPAAPFPNCGPSADATLENCPLGSTTCTAG